MKQYHGQKIKQTILDAGLELWPHVSNASVAKKLGYSHARINYYFSKENIKDAVADYAVEIGNSNVITQLILCKHRAVAEMSAPDREQHLRNALHKVRQSDQD